VPVTGALSGALLEWKEIQEIFKGKRILAPGGIAFAGAQFVFAGYSGEPFSNRAFNLRLRAACRALGVGEITAHGLRHSAATILLNHVGKDLREIQELLRHKNIRTPVRYTHVGYEQTRQTAKSQSAQALGHFTRPCFWRSTNFLSEGGKYGSEHCRDMQPDMCSSGRAG
jgi:integrase